MSVRHLALGLGLLLASTLLAVPSPGVASPSATTTSSVSAGTSATAPSAPAQRPAPRWRPQNRKAIFNHPYGGDEARFAIQNYVVKAIRNTPKGGTIRIAVYSFDRHEVTDALLAARKRGVRVQLLFNDHQTTGAQKRLFQRLGRNPSKANFAYRCHHSCRASRDNMHSKFYLFTRTGGVDHVVMVGSANMMLNGVKNQWNDLLSLTREEDLHDTLVDVFDDMRKDYGTDQPFRTYCFGAGNGCGPVSSNQFLRVFPRKATPSSDAALSIIDPIQCVYRANGRQQRTVVRMAMHAMRGPRGDYLARALRQLWAEGCNVQVIYGLMGARTKREIGAATRRGRIPLRSAGFDTNGDGFVNKYTHQKYLAIGGMYGGKITKTTFTGSSNWSSRGTSGDEIIYSLRGPGVYGQYLTNFRFMWNSNRNTRNAYTTTPAVHSTVSFPQADGTVDRRVITVSKATTTVEPDGLRFGGPFWEND